MALSNKEVALRKRQQIDSSKRAMFAAVAVAAFVSGIALVVSFFLVQQIIFHGRVIAAKQDTLNTIKDNIKVVDELKDNVRALDANKALNSVKIKEESSALQSILDALPADPNADALGASLQLKFVGPIDGLRIDSLAVDTVDVSTTTGDGSDSSQVASVADVTGTEEAVENSIGFNMAVVGSADGLKELLTRFEKSIRVIELTAVQVQAESNGLRMIVAGRAFYEPGRVIELGTKVVKP